MVDLWQAEDGIILVSGAGMGCATLGSNYTCVIKEISITGGARDVEQVQVFGSGCNSALFEKKQELVEASMTTMKKNNYLAHALMSGAASDPFIVQGDRNRSKVNILYQWADRVSSGGNGMRILMQDAYCTSKEMSLSTDNSMEETFTFKCAPSDYFEDFAINQSGLSLTISGL